ncbi:MAG: gliding motility-associated C-terminal domain-containing protein [Bacteroidia bacterium]
MVPAVSISLPSPSICPGETATLDAGAGYVAYAWSNSSNSQFIQTSNAGSYSVSVTDPNGCTGTATGTVTVFPQSTVSISPASPSICEGDTATLTASGAFPTYAWSNGQSTAPITATSPGSYSVTITDANGCTASSSAALALLSRPVPNLGNDVALCDGASQALDAGAGFASYLWSNAASTQSITVSSSGAYSVTVTGANGCEGSDDVNVQIQPPIVVNLGLDTVPLCADGDLILDAGAGYDTYLWANGLGSDRYLVVTDSGMYAVTVTDIAGCTGEDNQYLELVDLPVLEIPSVIVCPGESVTIDAGAGFTSYLWSNGATTQAITTSQPGDYTVTVTFANCEIVDEMTLSDECNSTIDIPNVFSPNGDGINDVFQLRGQNIEKVDFWVADRWGKILFIGNSLTSIWDGKVNGNDVPEGVYFIGLHYKYVDEIEFHDDGMSLTLMR